MKNLVGEIRKFRHGDVEWTVEVLSQDDDTAEVEVTTFSASTGGTSYIRTWSKGELEGHGFNTEEE